MILNQLTLLWLIALTSIVSTQAKNQPAKKMQSLNDDFLVGFETGIFLRKNPE